jgi:hypothetical protein
LRTCETTARRRRAGVRRSLASPRRAGGWALLTALLAALLVGLGGMTAQVSARVEREREREDELLRTGTAIARALTSYRASPLVSVPEFPRDLTELVEDRRGPRVLRHLRAVPRDPSTDQREWILVRDAGRIVGVRSASTRPPLRRVGFPPEYASFEKARTLGDWTFTAAAAAQPAAPGRPASPAGPQAPSSAVAGPKPSVSASQPASQPASPFASLSAHQASQPAMQIPSTRPNPESTQR